MLKLSKKAEYALLVVYHLGRLPPGSKATVAEIAEAQDAPRVLLAKVMQGLKRAGVLASTKGVAGGYALQRPVEEIFFLEVIRPFEEYMALSRCSDPNVTPCDRAGHCALNDPMNTLNDFVMRQLQPVTIAAFMQMQPTLTGCFGGASGLRSSVTAP